MSMFKNEYEKQNEIDDWKPTDPEEADFIEDDEEDENEGIEIVEENLIKENETKTYKNDDREKPICSYIPFDDTIY
ncbi:hypothetical protein ACWO4B_003239 [Clostridium sporogenes]